MILRLPVEDIGKEIYIEDNTSFAVDSDGVAWMAGFWNKKLCRAKAIIESPDLDSF